MVRHLAAPGRMRRRRSSLRHGPSESGRLASSLTASSATAATVGSPSATRRITLTPSLPSHLLPGTARQSRSRVGASDARAITGVADASPGNSWQLPGAPTIASTTRPRTSLSPATARWQHTPPALSRLRTPTVSTRCAADDAGAAAPYLSQCALFPRHWWDCASTAWRATT